MLTVMPRSSSERPRVSPKIHTLDDAITALRGGELVVYPTETFYGIGADPASRMALGRLYAIKGRDAMKGVALIAADQESAFSLAREVPGVAHRLADCFWPGPLTLVLPARAGIAPELVGPGGGIGVRVSSHPIAHALAAGFGAPITATSANLAGKEPARTVAQAREALGGKVKVFLDGGISTAVAPSTVLEVTGDEWRVLREGAVSRRQIAAALAGEALE
jgi:L-threonylcarbamoyladenylate synthase